MKTILAFGDSNTWGAKPVAKLGVIERHAYEDRWTSVMQAALGDGYRVIPEGLNARTTVFDDPIDGAHKNGRPYLFPCLESHAPLDLVIVALGVNDLKTRFAKTAWDIACGAGTLLDLIANPPKPLIGGMLERLLVSPPPLGSLGVLAGHFAGMEEKSRELAAQYSAIAEMRGCHFLDAGAHIQASDVDGVHFMADQHAILGAAMADKVREILG